MPPIAAVVVAVVAVAPVPVPAPVPAVDEQAAARKIHTAFPNVRVNRTNNNEGSLCPREPLMLNREKMSHSPSPSIISMTFFFKSDGTA